MTTDRLRQLARGLGALAGLVLLVAGVPVALVVLAGWPLPHSLPSLDAIREALEQGWSPDGIVALKALAVVCWVAWAELAACAVVELAAALRGRRSARVPLAGPLQPLVAHLVAVVLLAFAPAAGTGSPAQVAPSLAAAVARYGTAPAMRLTAVEKPPQAMAPASPAVPERAAPKQVVVRPRDNLWDLAERHLRNPLRWREIWEPNRSRPQPDGRPLTNPDLIRSGWTLLLPPDAIDVEDASPGPSVGHPVPSFLAAPTPLEPLAEPSTSASPRQDRPGEPKASPAADRAIDPSPSRDTRSRPPVAPVPVKLPSGSTVAASFAAGVAAAVATGRLWRRRSYRPSRPRPAVLALPPDLRATVRSLLRATAPTQAAELTVSAAKEPSLLFSYTGLSDPEPARLPIGVRGDCPVELELTSLGGLRLDGPGGPGVARALVAALAAKGRACVTELLVPDSTARSLLPGVDQVTGIQVTPDLDTALTEAEVELIRRTRLLAVREAADFATYRQTCPEDLLPALILVTDEVRDQQGQRLQAVAELGSRLGVGVIACGAQGPCATQIHVDEDGAACNVFPESLAAEVSGATLHCLTESEFGEVLAVLAAARGEEPVVPERVTDSGEQGGQGPAVPDAVSADRPETSVAAVPEPVQVNRMPRAGSAVGVRLLGPYRIEAGGDELRTGLRSAARELLAFYLLRPEGAGIEAAADALWPEVEPERASERFWTALGNLRSRIRQATGVDQPLIEKEGERYRIQSGVFDVDLWRFQDAVAEAAGQRSNHDVEPMLARAARAYGGELLESSFYEWAEPAREELRRRALDALVRLAELRAGRGDKEGALAAVEQAIGVDPYAEALYRRAIVLLGELDRVDVARQLFRQLGARLADLDSDPEDETVRLVDRLSASHAAEPKTKAVKAGSP